MPVRVAARVLQAVGAAAMVPTSLGLLPATCPPERRADAVRAWTAVGGVAAALAPIVGGALVNLDRRWICRRRGVPRFVSWAGRSVLGPTGHGCPTRHVRRRDARRPGAHGVCHEP
ncbi:MFS transporter, partial [Streptomyces sp. NPDC055005]